MNREQINQNFDKLKPSFVKYHPFMEIMTGDAMFELMNKSEEYVREAFDRVKMTYYGCYEI